MATTPHAQFDAARHAYERGECELALRLLGQLTGTIGEHVDVLHLAALAEAKRGSIEAADAAFARAIELATGRVTLYRDWARAHSGRGAHARAEQILAAGLSRHPDDRELLLALGEVKRSANDRDSAASVFDRLLDHNPGDTQALYARAIVELERGGDAREAFARALAAAPANRQILLGAASAHHEAGETDQGIAMLEEAIARSPDWIDGLRALSRLRSERGDGDNFADGFLSALRQRPADVGLWASFLGVLASGLRFEQVLAHLPDARAAAGEQRLLDMFEAQALAETGRLDDAGRAFAALEGNPDQSFAPMQMRFLLRAGRYAEAASVGERSVGTSGAPWVWPLLALAWRKLGDSRWEWLERYDVTVAETDLPLDAAELDEIAELLRSLHRDAAFPYDQSARGGTQTHGMLFNRTDPPIVRLRAALARAVEDFVATLPPMESGHPFLGRPRGPIEIVGSWSIRLKREGFHVSHVHPQGWISSACYIALPDIEVDDPHHRGWLKLGESPPELGLDLPPVRYVMPKPGRLALFPSIMWHGTVPFEAGERLSVAFDAVPRRG